MSGVVPSTSAALGSAFCFNKVRTVAMSRVLTALTSRTSSTVAATMVIPNNAVSMNNANTLLDFMLELYPSRAFAVLIHGDAGHIDHRQPQIRRGRGAFLDLDVLVAF